MGKEDKDNERVNAVELVVDKGKEAEKEEKEEEEEEEDCIQKALLGKGKEAEKEKEEDEETEEKKKREKEKRNYDFFLTAISRFYGIEGIEGFPQGLLKTLLTNHSSIPLYS